jgi:mono/diheme cytochrome c family protein
MKWLIGILGVVVLMASYLLAQNFAYQPDRNWRVPQAAAAQQNPLFDKPEAVAGGRKLFLRNCAECHGRDGTGIEKKHSADLQLPLVQEQSDGVLFWKITNGNTGRGMPSWSKLPELQRWQLVLYVRTLKSPRQSPGAN